MENNNKITLENFKIRHETVLGVYNDTRIGVFELISYDKENKLHRVLETTELNHYFNRETNGQEYDLLNNTEFHPNKIKDYISKFVPLLFTHKNFRELLYQAARNGISLLNYEKFNVRIDICINFTPIDVIPSENTNPEELKYIHQNLKYTEIPMDTFLSTNDVRTVINAKSIKEFHDKLIDKLDSSPYNDNLFMDITMIEWWLKIEPFK